MKLILRQIWRVFCWLWHMGRAAWLRRKARGVGARIERDQLRQAEIIGRKVEHDVKALVLRGRL